MDFDQSHYYNWNKFLLHIIGQWPYDNRLTNYIRKTIVVSAVIVGIFIIVSGLITPDIRFNQAVNLVSLLSVMVTICICLSSHYMSANKYQKLMDDVCNDWREQRVINIIKIKESYAKVGKTFTIAFVVYVFGIYAPLDISITVVNIITTHNVSERNFPFDVGWVFSKEIDYYSHLIFIYCIFLIIVIIIIANESMFVVYVYHVCGMFAVVRYYLKCTRYEKEKAMNNQTSNHSSTIYSNIITSIKIHQKAIAFVVTMESYYSFSFFIEIVGFVLFSTFTLVQVTNLEKFYVKLMVFFIAQVVYIATLNFMGQKVLDASTKISEEVYSSEWYTYDVRVQKLMLMVIARSQIPCTLTANKFFVLSAEKFQWLIRNVLSYCLVVKKFR